jgi:hypothetical protein
VLFRLSLGEDVGNNTKPNNPKFKYLSLSAKEKTLGFLGPCFIASFAQQKNIPTFVSQHF